MAELKPKRKGNYHHNGNPKHGLYPDNVALFNTAGTRENPCWIVDCPKCDANIGGFWQKELAEEAWNRRADNG